VRQCQATLKLKVEVTPERLQSLVTQFAEYGVTKAQLEKRIQRRLEAMTPGIMVQLGRVFTSLRDGMSEPGDWFPDEATPGAGQDAPGEAPVPQAGTNPRQAVRDRLQARKTARAGATGATEAGATPPAADPLPPHPQGSPALQDIIRFARAAATAEDVERVRQIALTLETEEEAHTAQSHINAAAARVG
jgi:hypothetical protein